jgi:hypothetical protein
MISVERIKFYDHKFGLQVITSTLPPPLDFPWQQIQVIMLAIAQNKSEWFYSSSDRGMDLEHQIWSPMHHIATRESDGLRTQYRKLLLL